MNFKTSGKESVANLLNTNYVYENRYSMTTADPTRPHLVDKLPQSRYGYGIRSISGTGEPDMMVPVRQACLLHSHRYSCLSAGRKSSRPKS